MTIRPALPLVALLLAHGLPAQPRLDVGTGGRQDVCAVMGGGVRVVIDRETPLEVLIARLNEPWEERETGKGYWIGYTDDMYSIAAHGDDAIPPLLDLATNSTVEHTRTGALWTLHLIGINRTVVGRFFEKFQHAGARASLLTCLQHDALREPAMRLLMRDPWLSDVPQLIDVMRASEDDCWPIVDALNRYALEEVPLDLSLPKSLGEITLNLELPKGLDHEAVFHLMLGRVKAQGGDAIVLEEGLEKQPVGGDRGSFAFMQPGGLPDTHSVGSFLFYYVGPEHSRAFSYIDFGSRVQRYRDGDVVHICSANTAKHRWLDWWTTRSPEYRESLARWTKAAEIPNP